MSSYSNLFYKDGMKVSYRSHLEATMWHRGVRLTKKSKKPFTCVFGCNIPAASSYLNLQMFAGSGGIADSLADFALCCSHQRKTETWLGRPISTEVDTAEIIKAWAKILEMDCGSTNDESHALSSSEKKGLTIMERQTSYSWERCGEVCATKTVDKTLLREGSSGIPKDVVSFFTGRLLSEGQEHRIDLNIVGTWLSCTVSKRQGRHRIFSSSLKRKLIEYDIQIGDLLFFERYSSVSHRFFLSALNKRSEVVVQPDLSTKSGEDRGVYTTARVRHKIFCEQVKRAYNRQCCISGIKDSSPSILIASHIKPWKDSTGIEKTDKFNGLLLAPHYDKLFDKGFISFSDTGQLLISNKVSRHLANEWRLKGKELSTVYPETLPYLDFHRKRFGFSSN